MSIQQIWQTVIYIFRCFNPIRKPEYTKYTKCNNDDLDYDKLPEYDPSKYAFIIVRD